MFIPPKSILDRLLFCRRTDSELNQTVALAFGHFRQCHDPALHSTGKVMFLDRDEAVTPPNYTGSFDAALALLHDFEIPTAMEDAIQWSGSLNDLKDFLPSAIVRWALDQMATNEWQERARRDREAISAFL